MTDETPVYGLPYPQETDHVIDGDNAMQALAEATEAALVGLATPDILVLTGAGDGMSVNNVPAWNTGAPNYSRGAWTFGPSSRLIKPPAPGWYFVSAHFAPEPNGGVGGGSDFNTYGIRIQTMVQGNDPNTQSTNWMRENQSVKNGEDCRLHAAGIVLVDTTPNRGIQIQLTPGSMPGVLADNTSRLQIIRMAALS